MTSLLKPLSVALKEARTNKGISLEEVYKATKIHPHILRSLEEGTTLQLPDVYLKSYSKIYARYLGMTEKDLEGYFRFPSSKDDKKDKGAVSDFSLKSKKEKIINIALSASSLHLRLMLLVRPHLKKIFAAILAVVIIVAMVRLVASGRGKGSAASKTKQHASQKEIPAAGATAPTHVAAKKEEPPKAAVPIPPVSDTLRLTIFAQYDVWVQVAQDDLVVFKGTLKKLSSETWQAKKSFELRTNNAGALKLELNGEILSPLGRKGQALRRVVITKEGLKVQ